MNAMDDTFIKDKDPMKSIVENLVQNIKDEALKRAQVVNACELLLKKLLILQFGYYFLPSMS